ncbi:MAG: lipid II flippase MurJ [Terracidiphilus sp.]
MSERLSTQSSLPAQSKWARAIDLLRPSHAHTAFSATILMMGFNFLSRIMGLVRTKYIAYLFGHGTDAFYGAFLLPDMISYFLVGGALSATLVTILSRYRDTGREAEEEHTLSVILTTMFLVLSFAIVLAEILTPLYVHHMFPDFDTQKTQLCIQLTRILLPAQLCFFASGVFGAVLFVRKQFSVQGIAPLIYNLGTIAGGLLLVKRMGISSLAVGTVAGAFLGNFLLNGYFVHRVGLRFRLILDWRDEGLREWVRLSLPLMAGVSLVSADGWIITHFASSTDGAITLMNIAKQLFAAPIGILAGAAGAASMPFFANLWSTKRHYDFATSVADSVARVTALGLLAASAMAALAAPLVELIYLGGRFSAEDCRACAAYFIVLSLSLFLWSAQAIYSRAFYAAGNTFLPMVAATAVTLASIPIYAALYHWQGAMGLAMASDIGIALQTISLAVLLHQRRMVSLASLDYAEIGRCLLAAVSGGAAVGLLFWWLGKLLQTALPGETRWIDLAVLVAGTALWLTIVKGVLELTGSALPRATMKRLGIS